MLLAGGIDAEEKLAEFAALEAGEGAAILSRDEVKAEVGVHVAIGVEDVFEKPGGAAVANAIELRPDEGAFAADRVAGGAVGGEEECAA